MTKTRINSVDPGFVLCAAADINRATFYTHYETKTALLEEIEVEKSRELFETLGTLWVGEEYFSHVLDGVLKYLKEHPVMREIFLNARVAGNGLAMRLREQGVEVAFREYEGCFHAFDMMGAGTKIGKDARAFLLEQFRRAQDRYFADN